MKKSWKISSKNVNHFSRNRQQFRGKFYSQIFSSQKGFRLFEKWNKKCHRSKGFIFRSIMKKENYKKSCKVLDNVKQISINSCKIVEHFWKNYKVLDSPFFTSKKDSHYIHGGEIIAPSFSLSPSHPFSLHSPISTTTDSKSPTF